MPGYDYDDFDDNGQEQSGPKALREALEKAKADLKARDAKLAEQENQIAELSKAVKSNTLRDALSDAGIDPKYARFAERDEVEPDVDSVKQWVEDNRDVYAFLAKAAAPQGEQVEGEQEQAPPADEIDPELVAALQAGQGLESTGQPVGSSNIAELLAGTDPSKFNSEAEIDNLLRQLGAPTPGS